MFIVEHTAKIFLRNNTAKLIRKILSAKIKGEFYMKREEILNAIKSLAKSQGFYGRLYERIMEVKEENEENFNEFMLQLENENFSDTLDLVMYFEC